MFLRFISRLRILSYLLKLLFTLFWWIILSLDYRWTLKYGNAVERSRLSKWTFWDNLSHKVETGRPGCQLPNAFVNLEKVSDIFVKKTIFTDERDNFSDHENGFKTFCTCIQFLHEASKNANFEVYAEFM